MKKKFILPLATTAFLCLSGSLNAAIVPEGTEKDSRIHYVEYDTDTVVKIRAKVAHTVTVQLDKGESAEQGVVAMGDAQAWNMAVKGNNLIFKPTAESPQTNLTVITNKRIYVFDLSLAGCSYNKKGKKVCTPPTYLLRFTYPDDIAAARAAANRQQARAFQMKLKYGLDGAKTPLNYNYYGVGEKKIAPAAMWDDGRFTYLRYPNNKDLPTIYKLNPDGSEMLVNTRTDGDTFIIHETAEEFVMRLGDSVLGIKNKGYKVGEFNHLGTNDRNSVRLIKGEE